MATAALSRTNGFPSAHAEELQNLLLRLWEKTNAERDMKGVLAAVVDILMPVVPFTATCLISFASERPQLYSSHAGASNTVQIAPASAASELASDKSELSSGPKNVPLDWNSLERRLASGKPFTCPDLLAKQSWQEHESYLARHGARAYTLQPLVLGGGMIGAAILWRSEPVPFTSEQLGILRAAASALAVAFSNALENQKAAARIDELEGELRTLRSHISDSAAGTGPKPKSPAPCIQDEMLYLRDRMLDPEPARFETVDQTNINAQLEHEERKLIETILAATHGRVSGKNGAALRLGLPASTLEFRIHRLAIDKFQFRRRPQKRVQPAGQRAGAG